MSEIKRIKVNTVKSENSKVILPEVRVGVAVGKKVGPAVAVGAITTTNTGFITGAEIAYNGGNKTAHAAGSIGIPLGINSNAVLTTLTAKAGAEFDFKGNVDFMAGARVDVTAVKLAGLYAEGTYSGQNGFTAQIGVQFGIFPKSKD